MTAAILGPRAPVDDQTVRPVRRGRRRSELTAPQFDDVHSEPSRLAVSVHTLFKPTLETGGRTVTVGLESLSDPDPVTALDERITVSGAVGIETKVTSSGARSSLM